MARTKKKVAKKDQLTQISISLPTSLVNKIDKMADGENRNRSNFISNTLEELAKKALS